MKLVQKHKIKGLREFEITDDVVRVRIKSLWEDKEKTVPLETISPEPVVNKSMLEFYGRVRCSPAISLFLDKPNKTEFDAFVSAVKEKSLEAYQSFAGIGGTAESVSPDQKKQNPEGSDVDVESLGMAINMLKMQMNHSGAETFISALEGVRDDSGNSARLVEAVAAFSALGVEQGAVLTYAPYIGSLLAKR